MIKAMIIGTLVSMGALVGYVSLLPLEIYQKVIILVLSGFLMLFMFIGVGHMAEEAYLDEVKKIAEKVGKTE